MPPEFLGNAFTPSDNPAIVSSFRHLGRPIFCGFCTLGREGCSLPSTKPPTSSRAKELLGWKSVAVGQLASGCIPTACSDSDNVMVAIPRSWFAPCQPKATKAQPNLPLFFIGRGSSQPSVAPKAGIRATTHPTRLWTHPSQLAPAGGSCTRRGAGSGGHGHW